MAEFSIATNFDPYLLSGINKLNQESPKNKITEVFGSYKYSITGSGRASKHLPEVANLKEYIDKAHNLNLNFNYLMSAIVPEKPKEFYQILAKGIEKLIDQGIDVITIGDLEIAKFIKKEYPELKVNISVIAGIDSLEKVIELEELGINLVTLNQHTVNRDFDKLKELRKSRLNLKLYANISCLNHCPVRDEHYKFLANEKNWKIDPHMEHCVNRFLKKPVEFIKAPFIRPEDISFYENLGYKNFKLSDRREPTYGLLTVAKAYLSAEYHGNLFSFLFREGRKWRYGIPNAKIPYIYIDNDSLTKMDFISKISFLKGKELETFYLGATKKAVKIKNLTLP